MIYRITGQIAQIKEFLILNTQWRDEVLLIQSKIDKEEIYFVSNNKLVIVEVSLRFPIYDAIFPNKIEEGRNYETFGNNSLWYN